jgi:glycosyltransferase involved in cell wall biosynthesis
MKIIQIGSFPISSKTIQGGVEASVYGLAIVQATTDEVIVIDVPRSELQNDDVEKAVSIKVFRFSARSGSNYTSLFRIPKIVSIIRSLQADICHIHTTSLFSLVLYVFLRLFGIKTVVTIHGLAHKEKQNAWRKRKSVRNYIKYLSHSFTEFLFLSMCPQFIVDTHYVAEAILQYKKDRKLLRCPICKVIPQGINDDFFQLKRLFQPGQLLSVGSISKRKGHLLLIEAMAKIVNENPTVRLDILGALSDKDYYTQMQHSIKEKGLENHITIYPNIGYDEMLKFYTHAELFVLHTEEESQGIVFCEALAVGLPIVATNVGGVPWIVNDTKNGLLSEFGNVDLFAKHIIELLRNTELQKEFELNNKKQSLKFNWKTISNDIKTIYDSII